MAKPTVVSKDSFIGTMPPNFGFDAHRQRGCPSFRRAFRGLRGLPARMAGPYSSRQTAVDVAASASKSHREPQPFTSHRTG
jgi:hypothetical protein